jgi:hypothetical protein
MNMPLNIRELVRRGPSDRDDVQVIVAVAMREVSYQSLMIVTQ